MSEKQPIQGPWRVEADTLPEMAYDHYRHTLIHETSSIKAYLAPKHQERTILVAPKGYGKTLLLIAKKKSFLEARSGQIVMAENRFIDRPLGIFPVIKRELLIGLRVLEILVENIVVAVGHKGIRPRHQGAAQRPDVA